MVWACVEIMAEHGTSLKCVVTMEVTKTLGLEGWNGSERLLDCLDQWQLHLGSVICANASKESLSM